MPQYAEEIKTFYHIESIGKSFRLQWFHYKILEKKTIADLHGISLFYKINKSFKRKKVKTRPIKMGMASLGKQESIKIEECKKCFNLIFLEDKKKQYQSQEEYFLPGRMKIFNFKWIWECRGSVSLTNFQRKVSLAIIVL